MGRIYRRFIDKGVRLYVNNRRVEAFDPTYWMPSARHTKVEGLTETKSALVDSWTVQVPVTEGSLTRPRSASGCSCCPSTPGRPCGGRRSITACTFSMTTRFVSAERAGGGDRPGAAAETEEAPDECLAAGGDRVHGEADEAFGVAANKQGVRLQQFAVDVILEHDDGRFLRTITDIRKTIRDRQLKIAAAEQAGQTSDAERHATDTEGVQGVACPRRRETRRSRSPRWRPTCAGWRSASGRRGRPRSRRLTG